MLIFYLYIYIQGCQSTWNPEKTLNLTNSTKKPKVRELLKIPKISNKSTKTRKNIEFCAIFTCSVMKSG